MNGQAKETVPCMHLIDVDINSKRWKHDVVNLL